MSSVAAIGAQPDVAGFALAGALVYPAEHADEVQAAWHELPDAVTVVILTEAAASALEAERTEPSAPLTVVMPP
jgi:vacuolar-type H+-ATPase subunit F/Vma7